MPVRVAGLIDIQGLALSVVYHRSRVGSGRVSAVLTKRKTVKAKPFKYEENQFKPCELKEATHVLLTMVGPIRTQMLPLRVGGKRPSWEWNGDTEKPTLTPSVLCDNGDGGTRSHFYVTDGKVQFLGDCTHSYAGQTVDLLEPDEDWL